MTDADRLAQEAQRMDDYEWALDRVTRMCASALVDAQVYRQKLLKGFGYPNETFSRAQDYRALTIILSALQQAQAHLDFYKQENERQGEIIERYQREQAQAPAEREIRELLWLTHGCPVAALYGDDGEMQCASGRHRPIDFKREPLPSILDRILTPAREQAQARPICVCTVDDGLVQEWVSKARAVAKSKGYDVEKQAQARPEIETLVSASRDVHAAVSRTSNHHEWLEPLGKLMTAVDGFAASPRERGEWAPPLSIQLTEAADWIADFLNNGDSKGLPSAESRLRRIAKALPAPPTPPAAAPPWQPLQEALTEICRRIEQPLGADVETHREVSAARRRILDAVYAIAENALCALPPPPARADKP